MGKIFDFHIHWCVCVCLITVVLQSYVLGSYCSIFDSRPLFVIVGGGDSYYYQCLFFFLNFKIAQPSLRDFEIALRKLEIAKLRYAISKVNVYSNIKQTCTFH